MQYLKSTIHQFPLVKENSRARDLLIDDDQINEIITLERTNTNTGSHDGLSGFFHLAKKLKEKNSIKYSSSVVHLDIFNFKTS